MEEVVLGIIILKGIEVKSFTHALNAINSMMISKLTCGLLLVSGCSTQLIASQPATTTENSISLAEINNEVPALSNNVMTSLDDYKWKNRLLLVFAPKEDATYQQQMQLFKEQPGFDERDLFVVQLLAEGTSRINNQPIDAQLATQIRERFNVAPQEFQVILVGKDGTSKRRDRSPVPPAVIFNSIDAMPMRQQEMRSPN